MEKEPGHTPQDDAVPIAEEVPALYRLGQALLVVSVCAAACYMLLHWSAGERLGFGQLSRLWLINDWYTEHASPAQPCIVALGDSLALSAFNGRWFNEQADELPEAWNLSSSACTYPETMLDIRQPSLEQATIIFFVSPMTSFLPSKLGLESRKADTYALLGLPAGWQAVYDRYGSELDTQARVQLEMPRWQHVLRSRWRLAEFLKNLIKRNVGPDTQRTSYLLDSYVRDLHYATFGNNLSEDERREQLAARIVRLSRPAASGIDNPRCVAALRDTLQGIEAHSARLIVVLYPVDPAYREWLAVEQLPYDAGWLREQLGSEFEILDLSDCLEPGMFRDELHLSEPGSISLTSRIRDYLLATPGDGC